MPKKQILKIIVDILMTAALLLWRSSLSHLSDSAGSAGACLHGRLYGKRHCSFQSRFRLDKNPWTKLGRPSCTHALRLLGICVYVAAFGHSLEYDDKHDKKVSEKAVKCPKVDFSQHSRSYSGVWGLCFYQA